ncbi:MAG: hypothetical protein E7174_02140 [Firmicutes bacterium]|nr:hypothetical protein [Bacillota bacterium]
MILDIKANPMDWNKKIYISKKLKVEVDDEDNEIVIYDKPTYYEFNYQPVNSYSEIVEFGEKCSIMKKMVIPIAYINMFKEFDVAYLDGVSPKEEIVNGENANYRLLPPRNGNSVIVIYLEKIEGK